MDTSVHHYIHGVEMASRILILLLKPAIAIPIVVWLFVKNR